MIMKPGEGPATVFENLLAIIAEIEKEGTWNITPDEPGEEGLARQIRYDWLTLHLYGQARYSAAEGYRVERLRVESPRTGLRLSLEGHAVARRLLDHADKTGGLPISILDEGTFCFDMDGVLLGNPQIVEKVARTIQKAGELLKGFVEYDAEQRVGEYMRHRNEHGLR